MVNDSDIKKLVNTNSGEAYLLQSEKCEIYWTCIFLFVGGENSRVTGP